MTTTQSQQIADLPTAENRSFSPGSNRFWRLGYYPLGVFPEPLRTVDFISYEQMKDGIRHLEGEHPDKMNVEEIGNSPGHYNNATARDDPKGMFVAEVTNDIGTRTPSVGTRVHSTSAEQITVRTAQRGRLRG